MAISAFDLLCLLLARHVYLQMVGIYLQALLDICHKITWATNSKKGASAVRVGSSLQDRGGAGGLVKESQPFDAMNNIVANLLLNLTR